VFCFGRKLKSALKWIGVDWTDANTLSSISTKPFEIADMLIGLKLVNNRQLIYLQLQFIEFVQDKRTLEICWI
jgi:hypothetical protein